MCSSDLKTENEIQKKRGRSSVRDPYVVRVQLAVAGQAVQQSLDVGSEDSVQGWVVGLIQVLSQTVPEVKGDLNHLGHSNTHTHTHSGSGWLCASA